MELGAIVGQPAVVAIVSSFSSSRRASDVSSVKPVGDCNCQFILVVWNERCPGSMLWAIGSIRSPSWILPAPLQLVLRVSDQRQLWKTGLPPAILQSSPAFLWSTTLRVRLWNALLRRSRDQYQVLVTGKSGIVFEKHGEANFASPFFYAPLGNSVIPFSLIRSTDEFWRGPVV